MSESRSGVVGGVAFIGLSWLMIDLALGALAAYVGGVVLVVGVVLLGVIGAPLGFIKVLVFGQTGRLKDLAYMSGGFLAGSILGTPLMLLLAWYAFAPISGGSGDTLPPGFLPATLTLITGIVFLLLTYGAPVAGVLFVSLVCWSEGSDYVAEFGWTEAALSVAIGAGIPLGILQWGDQLHWW